MKLSGKSAVVTGGAGGIGSSIVRLLAREGAKVAIADLADEDGNRLAKELCDQGGAALYQRTDVARSREVETLMDRTAAELGSVDILVTCAGWMRIAMAIEATEEDFDRTLSSHVKGTWLCAKYALPHMIRRKGGAIVALSSMQALAALPGRIAYEAAKGGISAMARALAVEYGPAGVRVNAICPGVIMTPKLIARNAGITEAEREARIESYPLRRLGSPEDIAKAALFLASDEASWISGVNLAVDGGMTAQLAEAVHFPPFRRLWQEIPKA
jgi:NAD(P)-dependent dehydrogenase (short-subunit alcohol dehydrogenase family)